MNKHPMMTREEENCLKTALAMLVVKHRLLQKQSSSQNHDSSSSAASLCLPTKRQEPSPPNKTSKKLRTMDSLVFPWTTTPDVGDQEDAQGQAAANNNNLNPNERQNANATGDGQTMHDLESQKDHIQTMVVTAVRTALKLMGSGSNLHMIQSNATGGIAKKHDQTSPNNEANDANPTQLSVLLDDWTNVLGLASDKAHPLHSIWKSLDALACHISKQLTLSLDLAYQNPGPNNEGFWIGTWIEESLHELLAFSSSAAAISATKVDNSPMEILSASFLVWYGILFGGYGMMATLNSAPNNQLLTNDARSSPGARMCRHLFVETFCHLLRDQDMLRSPFSADNHCLVVGPAPNSTPTTNNTRNAPRRLWKRMFQPHRNDKRPSDASVVSTSSRGNTNHDLEQQCFDLWLVHGLRLVQTCIDDHKEESEERRKRPNNNNNNNHGGHLPQDVVYHLDPESFLPPENLVQFYVREHAAEWEAVEEASGEGGHSSPTPPKLDVGAKLMAMVALYDSLENAEVI